MVETPTTPTDGVETPAVETPIEDESLLDGGVVKAESVDDSEDKTLLDAAADKAKQSQIADLKAQIEESTDEAEKKGLQDKLAELEKPKEAVKAEAKAVPDKYEFKLPEGLTLDKNAFDKVTPIFKELKLSQDEAQKLVDIYIDAMKAQSEAMGKKFQQFVAESKEETIKSLGAEWKKEVGYAAKVRDRLLSKETIEELNASGLSNRISLIRDLIKIGKMISEDVLVDGATGNVNANKTLGEVLYPNQGKQ